LAECPTEFLLEPCTGGTGRVELAVVVADLLWELAGRSLGAEAVANLRSPDRKQHHNRLRLTPVAAWLLHDPWFRSRPELAERAQDLLNHGLHELAGLVQAPLFTTDADHWVHVKTASAPDVPNPQRSFSPSNHDARAPCHCAKSGGGVARRFFVVTHVLQAGSDEARGVVPLCQCRRGRALCQESANFGPFGLV
jgi:hypothetical protein